MSLGTNLILNWYKLNTDGSGNLLPKGGIGFILRNRDGTAVFAGNGCKGHTILFNNTVIVRQALLAAKARGIRKIHSQTDAEFLIYIY